MKKGRSNCDKLIIAFIPCNDHGGTPDRLGGVNRSPDRLCEIRLEQDTGGPLQKVQYKAKAPQERRRGPARDQLDSSVLDEGK